MNDIPGDIKSALEALDNQRRDYVWARSSAKSDNEARRMAHIAGSSFARWEDKQELNTLAFKISTDRKLRADIILESVLDKAAEIKAAGLDSKKESVRQSVASEILDRLMGKPAQPVQQTGRDGGPLEIVVKYEPDGQD